MKIINWSSKKFGSLEIFVDDEDYDRVKKYPWGVLKCVSSDVLYVKARRVNPDNPRQYVSLHRFILGIDNPKIFVDHKDGNGLNCQKHNLRIANCSQNCSNRGKQKNNSSGFKGVHIKRYGNSVVYQVSISINRKGFDKKTIYGGRFINPIEAAKKYNELARQPMGVLLLQSVASNPNRPTR